MDCQRLTEARVIVLPKEQRPHFLSKLEGKLPSCYLLTFQVEDQIVKCRRARGRFQHSLLTTNLPLPTLYPCLPTCSHLPLTAHTWPSHLSRAPTNMCKPSLLPSVAYAPLVFTFTNPPQPPKLSSNPTSSKKPSLTTPAIRNFLSLNSCRTTGSQHCRNVKLSISPTKTHLGLQEVNDLQKPVVSISP